LARLPSVLPSMARGARVSAARSETCVAVPPSARLRPGMVGHSASAPVQKSSVSQTPSAGRQTWSLVRNRQPDVQQESLWPLAAPRSQSSPMSTVSSPHTAWAAAGASTSRVPASTLAARVVGRKACRKLTAKPANLRPDAE
jgi:hypothetical protein